MNLNDNDFVEEVIIEEYEIEELNKLSKALASGCGFGCGGSIEPK